MTSTSIDRSGSRIDHLNVAVPNLASGVAFYEPVLASIAITKMLEIPPYPSSNEPDAPLNPAMTGFGLAGVKPYFWLIDHGTVGTNMHVAFTVDTPAEVDTFYEAALAAGATALHAPAIHTQYHDDYYGGFVLDPYGINLEAVCHRSRP